MILHLNNTTSSKLEMNRTFTCSFVIYFTLYFQNPVSCSRSVEGAKICPCEAEKRFPCATICGISTTYKSCDADEGYCNCPFSCPAGLTGNHYMCSSCRKPSGRQWDSCYSGNCKLATSEAFVCTDGKDAYCTCFPPVVTKSQHQLLHVDVAPNSTEIRTSDNDNVDDAYQEYNEDTESEDSEDNN